MCLRCDVAERTDAASPADASSHAYFTLSRLHIEPDPVETVVAIVHCG